jgi:hypothetical protein
MQTIAEGKDAVLHFLENEALNFPRTQTRVMLPYLLLPQLIFRRVPFILSLSWLSWDISPSRYST